MTRIAIIGIGAGCAGAMLFASVATGSWLSVMLFYLAPLPIMIAALGWSHWAALLAAAFGALALGLVFGWVFFFAFLAGAGIPAWWLGYLAMLARPIDHGAAGEIAGPSPATLEWYPPGRLVAWSAILAVLVVVVAIPNFGLDGASFHAGLAHALKRLLQIETGTAPDAPLSLPGVSNPQRLIDLLAETIPPAAAVIATLTNVFNLWLAARIVKFSGRLSRPWPYLPAMTIPRPLASVFAVAVVLSFAGGMVGILAAVLTAGLLMAFGVIGFAVLHAVTQGVNVRSFLLGGIYAVTLVFGWPVLALCLLGLVDTAFDLRGRLAGKRGPPNLPPN